MDELRVGMRENLKLNPPPMGYIAKTGRIGDKNGRIHRIE
jgi:hypothetical protein